MNDLIGLSIVIVLAGIGFSITSAISSLEDVLKNIEYKRKLHEDIKERREREDRGGIA